MLPQSVFQESVTEFEPRTETRRTETEQFPVRYPPEIKTNNVTPE